MPEFRARICLDYKKSGKTYLPPYLKLGVLKSKIRGVS